MSDLVVARNCAWLECFPEKPSWCRNEQVCQGRKSVKRFERSNGLDTALYKKLPLFSCFHKIVQLYCYVIVSIYSEHDSGDELKHHSCDVLESIFLPSLTTQLNYFVEICIYLSFYQ